MYNVCSGDSPNFPSFAVLSTWVSGGATSISPSPLVHGACSGGDVVSMGHVPVLHVSMIPLSMLWGYVVSSWVQDC